MDHFRQKKITTCHWHHYQPIIHHYRLNILVKLHSCSAFCTPLWAVGGNCTMAANIVSLQDSSLFCENNDWNNSHFSSSVCDGIGGFFVLTMLGAIVMFYVTFKHRWGFKETGCDGFWQNMQWSKWGWCWICTCCPHFGAICWFINHSSVLTMIMRFGFTYICEWLQTASSIRVENVVLQDLWFASMSRRELINFYKSGEFTKGDKALTIR